jgi:LysM repeat protein
MNDWKHLLTAVLAVFALGLTANDALAKKRSKYYTVKDGDTLSGIASRFGCIAKEILRINKSKIPNPDVIAKGLRLYMPKKCRKRRPVSSSPTEPIEDMVRGIKWAINSPFCKQIKQKPQKRFFRSSYRSQCGSGTECRRKHKAFTAFRTKNYGYFRGFGDKELNANNPQHYTQWIDFMEKKVRLNQLAIHPLKCAERAIKKRCKKCTPDPKYPGECKKKFPYKPRVLSGLRHRNTFRGGEVSNHVYGIAIDLDPSHNTCCGCVGKWKKHPKCRRKLPKNQRMIMPMCWVKEFEKFGFYWLGNDKLQDTMHFEFLGDPDRIRRAVRKYRNQ